MWHFNATSVHIYTRAQFISRIWSACSYSYLLTYLFKHTLFHSSSIQQVVKGMAHLNVAPLKSAHRIIKLTDVRDAVRGRFCWRGKGCGPGLSRAWPEGC